MAKICHLFYRMKKDKPSLAYLFLVILLIRNHKAPSIENIANGAIHGLS
jgi:hypothetical protein